MISPLFGRQVHPPKMPIVANKAAHPISNYSPAIGCQSSNAAYKRENSLFVRLMIRRPLVLGKVARETPPWLTRSTLNQIESGPIEIG